VPLPLIAAAIPAVGSYLAKNGLNVLAGIFKGKSGPRVEEAARMVEQETGIDIGKAADPQGLTDEELTRLKQFELEHEQALMRHSEAIATLDLEAEKLRLADVADARNMQRAAMLSGDAFTRRFVPLYAVGVTLVCFTYIFLYTFAPFLLDKGDQAHDSMVHTILGFLMGTALSTVIGFFFGSSQGSAKKSDQIAQLSERQTERPAARGEE
jgi:hypothetical protein